MQQHFEPPMNANALVIILVSAVFLAAENRAVSAAACRGCDSKSCAECVVKVGVYGYTPPTWRPWPATKFKSPTDREKVDRRLIRPEPFETPPPRSEASGVPRKTQPEERQPPVDPDPEVPPELPPQLRNKQPIPVPTSSTKNPQVNLATKFGASDATATPPASRALNRRREVLSTSATTTEPGNKVDKLTTTVGRKNIRGNIPAPTPAETHQAKPRRIASLNSPASTKREISGAKANNPLRLVSGHSPNSSFLKRAVANSPVSVSAKAAPEISANPLR